MLGLILYYSIIFKAHNNVQKKQKLADELDEFIRDIGGQTSHQPTPKDICRFLIWKDQFGKTPVYVPSCPAVGKDRALCSCQKRLAVGTVEINYMIGMLRARFHQRGWASCMTKLRDRVQQFPFWSRIMCWLLKLNISSCMSETNSSSLCWEVRVKVSRYSY